MLFALYNYMFPTNVKTIERKYTRREKRERKKELKKKKRKIKIYYFKRNKK